ncbi:MAG: ParB N-terminal domain-containing protein [Deltaproteobacteria bacterium]|nr:ParB N-terminal domain-containing protein [Deltaproteobacteria bacterium]
MAKTACTVPTTQIILDEEIYPRSSVYPKRISMFAENMRDGFKIDPVEVQIHPEYDDKYRILDGAHRWHAYKEIGATEISVLIIALDGLDPLIYAAKKAIGPLQLTEDEAGTTARRAYENNPRLISFEIGQLDLKIFRMNRLEISQKRIAKRLGQARETIRNHLAKMPELANQPKANLSRGFTVAQVAEKHGWTEPLVWSIALEGKNDLDRFKALNWGLRTWDMWNWNDCDKRFGDDWPGRIPAQMIAHILYYFSDQNDLVFDPMAGGGVVVDTCLAFNRKCWSFDMDDRPDTRPEIEPCFWDITNLKWPIKGKTKPDLIIFDPPYFKKQSNNYDPDGISGMSKANYLKFLESFFALVHLNAKKSIQMAFINADWRDFQNTPAKNETRVNSILINDYLWILNQSGWQKTHIFQAPLSSERFKANVVSAMQKKKIIGVTSRYVIISKIITH